MLRLMIRILALLLLIGAICLAQEPVLVWTRSPQHRILARHPQLLRNTRAFATLPIIPARLTDAERRIIEADPEVTRITPDPQYRTSLIPAIPVVAIPPVWDAGFTGRGESVAVVDTGVQASHPMFLGVRIEGKVFLKRGSGDPCFADDASTIEDLQGHGTRTASIIAGQAIPNFPGYFGAARGLGTLYVMKAGFRPRPNTRGCPPVSDGVLYASDIFESLDFIIRETPARIVNLSVGSPAAQDDDIFSMVSDYLADTYGLTLVFSAGNAGFADNLNSPGIAYNGITVANLDDHGTADKSDDGMHPSSTRGPTPGGRSKPDLAAPGTRIYAADITSRGLNVATGTSASTPIVSGAAALLRDAGVRHPLALKALLLNSTDPQDGLWRRDAGWGVLNAFAAFEQRTNVATGVLEPGASAWYRGFVTSPGRLTLVWNRHIGSQPFPSPLPATPLSLQLYRRDGTLMARADSNRDNVLAVAIPQGGDYVARVESASKSGSSEEFALAWTVAGMTPAAAPQMIVRCTHANPVTVGSTLDITCTVTNASDVDLGAVTGNLPVPLGFSNGGPQRFAGSLPARASRSATWRIGLPAVAGRYEFAPVATAQAFGGGIEASSTPVQLDLTADPGALTLDPAQIALTPASPSAVIRLPAGIALRSVTTTASWMRAVASAGRIDVAADPLQPAGVYEAALLVTSANGVTSRATVTYTVPVAPPVVESARIVADAVMIAGCPVPVARTAWSEAATDLQVWFLARFVTPADVLAVRWISPGGLAAAVTNLPSIEQAGGFCFASSLPARVKRAGLWRAEVLWNGVVAASVPFEIRAALPLEAGVCPSEPRLLRVCPQGNAEGHSIEYEFVRPDGEVDGTANGPEYAPKLPMTGVWRVRIRIDGVPLDPAISITVGAPEIAGVFEDGEFRFAVNGEGSRARVEWLDAAGASQSGGEWTGETTGSSRIPGPGRWKVRLYWDDVVIYTGVYDDRFPSALVDPATATVFDIDVHVTAQINAAQAGDRVTIDFMKSAAVIAGAVFDPVSEAGSWTFTAALPVAGAVGARISGQWEARVSINGIETARLPFVITRKVAPAVNASAPLATAAPIPIVGQATRQ